MRLEVAPDGIITASHKDGDPTWPAAYTKKRVKHILEDAEDPSGEYLCTPAAGDDVYFPRKQVDRQERKVPEDVVAGFKIFHEYDPSHRYGSGHDVAAGVGLDSSTSVFIDFTQFPCQVVATYRSNTIAPDTFGDEINREAKMFGKPIVAVENNKYDMAIGRLKQLYDNLFVMFEKVKRAGKPTKVRQWGWNTNATTKSQMLTALRKAIKDGHLELSDPELIAEVRAYTRDDFMESDEDVRLSTRHFDLLMACAIAWQMRDLAEATNRPVYKQKKYEPSSEFEETGEGAKDGGVRPHPIFPNAQIGDDEWEQPDYEPSSEYEK